MSFNGLFFTALALFIGVSTMYSQHVMPLPATMKIDSGTFKIDGAFSMRLVGTSDARTADAFNGFTDRLSVRTGIPIRVREVDGQTPVSLEVVWKSKLTQVPAMIEDESYTLRIGEEGGSLRANSFYGILRGLETYLQLVELNTEGFYVPFVTIHDAPRFPWRGLLIDACRHWMPVEVIKRNLDAMAMVKMNVLHWHLSEDQGFRVESKKFPKLHAMGSDENYYSHAQITEVVEYAARRGIRVVPEFDMPGHATSWFVGYPELASAPGPYQIERKWGIFDPTMDPTREETYKFLETFIAEMTALFPDEYFHIGGDEVNGKQWDANPKIQEFMRKNSLADNHALQTYFNRRVLAIVKKNGKKMIGWDEVFHPDLPKDIVVQSWRGQKSLAEGAKQGYQGILSFGYYLDHIKPASFHYKIDPIDTTIVRLTQDEQKRVLGGEACMWAEYVSPENIDTRIWPRAAAIAERLWSPATVADVEDMYRRLDIMNRRLELAGVTHRINHRRMLERLAANNPIDALQVLADVVEPMKNYERGKTRQYTSFTPLNRLVDAVKPESDDARIFSNLLAEFQTNTITVAGRAKLNEMLTRWKENNAKLEPLMSQSQLLVDVEPFSRDLADEAVIALKLMEVSEAKTELSEGQKNLFTAVLDRAATSKGALQLMIVPPVRKMFEALTK